MKEFLVPFLDRIHALAKEADADADVAQLSWASLVGFFRFWNLHHTRIDQKPELVLTHEGYLRAVWDKRESESIAVRFIGESQVSYVTFLPDPADQTKTLHGSGCASTEEFFEMAGIKAILRDGSGAPLASS